MGRPTFEPTDIESTDEAWDGHVDDNFQGIKGILEGPLPIVYYDDESTLPDPLDLYDACVAVVKHSLYGTCIGVVDVDTQSWIFFYPDNGIAYSAMRVDTPAGQALTAAGGFIKLTGWDGVDEETGGVVASTTNNEIVTPSSFGRWEVQYNISVSSSAVGTLEFQLFVGGTGVAASRQKIKIEATTNIINVSGKFISSLGPDANIDLRCDTSADLTLTLERGSLTVTRIGRTS